MSIGTNGGNRGPEQIDNAIVKAIVFSQADLVPNSKCVCQAFPGTTDVVHGIVTGTLNACWD